MMKIVCGGCCNNELLLGDECRDALLPVEESTPACAKCDNSEEMLSYKIRYLYKIMHF